MIHLTGVRFRRPQLAALVTLLMASLASCTDQMTKLSGPGVAHPELIVGAGVTAPDAERAALGRLARSLAVALNDPATRKVLKAHLRAAPFKEHKVELASYLRKGDAAGILARMASGRGKPTSDILADLNQLRSVELYMPVKAQRESWLGDTDVLVAAQLVEHDPIMAFDKLGNAVALDESGPPSQPTIVIVGTETRFNQPMLAASSLNTNDRDGQAIGTLIPLKPRVANLVACGEECGGGGDVGGGGGGTTIPPGLYLEFSRILDAKEPWPRGDPEVEVHIHTEDLPSAPGYFYDQACAGEHSPDPRYVFDQNDGFWSGRVMIYHMDSVPRPDARYNIIYWEDDNDSCTLKSGADVLHGYAVLASQLGIKIGMLMVRGWPMPVAAIAAIATIYANAGEWMLTNDDYIGIARVSLPEYPYYYPDNTHVIIDENGNLNGRANIVWH